MDIHKLIKNKTSIRAYKKDAVPLETVRKVIETASMAPSWANRQCWRFIIVDTNVGKNIIGQASGQPQIIKACKDAPYVIVLCAYIRESGVKNGLEYFMFDSGLAMSNLTLAAEAEGLATCIVGWFDEGAIRGLLNIPKEVAIVAFTPLGYADESKRPRKRKKQEDIVFYNYWEKSID
jgi:nitroreductase